VKSGQGMWGGGKGLRWIEGSEGDRDLKVVWIGLRCMSFHGTVAEWLECAV